ncbi:MAG TPA: putative lipid II flippase FtsW [Spirochaetia bacterium]|nr:putative lipid II flippase FtsW [Spirochaetia bacterium]
MERVEKERSDMLFVMLVVAVLGVGVALLFSSSYPFASRAYNDPLYLVKRQLLWAGLGAAAAFVFSLTPLEVFRRSMPLILLGTLGVALLPFIPVLGTSVLGSRRWITLLGLSFQPSELVKITLILYLASYFANREGGEAMSLNSLIPPFIVICVFSAIILLQNDYSTAIFVLVIGLAMLYITRVRALHLLVVTLFTVPLGFLLLFTREHRVQRILAFLDLSTYRSGSGYQIVNAKAALVSGGLWGKGLGRSTAKLGSLPMAHSDFIYAIIGEETGLLGALFVLALFALLVWRGFQIAFRAEDHFSYLVAFGVTASLGLQALLNMGVAVGLVPTTGVTLPFFSAGGSSIFATLVMCGLLVNVSRRVSNV